MLQLTQFLPDNAVFFMVWLMFIQADAKIIIGAAICRN